MHLPHPDVPAVGVAFLTALSVWQQASRVITNQPSALPTSAAVIIAVFTATLGFLAAWFLAKRARRDRTVDREAELGQTERTALLQRLSVVEEKLALVTQAVVPISTAFQAILIKQLTHFHTPEMDALLVKLGPPYTLTKPEFERLIVLLAERETALGDALDDSERDAARILPYIMRRVRDNRDRQEGTPLAFLLVVIPAELAEAVVAVPTKEG